VVKSSTPNTVKTLELLITSTTHSVNGPGSN
jgi:hypothetical protein